MISRMMGSQLRRPRGLLGRLVGRGMALVNRPINIWTTRLMNIRPQDRVLEVGFGSGVAIRRMSQLASSGFVAGIDHSETMVEQARIQNASAIREGRAELRWGEARDLPYEDSWFDKACAIQGIYFWPEPDAVLQELRRVLKPSGLIAITVSPKEELGRWRFTDHYYALYTGEEIVGMLTQAGFREAHLEMRRTRPRALCALAIK